MIKKRGPYDSPLQRERRRSILSNTRHLLETEGLEGVSMARIASLSNVSAKTPYNIFGSLDRLLLQTATARLDELLQEGQARLENPGIPKILAITKTAMEQFIDSEDFMRVVIAIVVSADARDGGSEPNMGWIQGFTLESLLIAQQNNELCPATDIHELSRILAANQWGMALMWQQELFSLDQLVRQAHLSNLITLLPFCIGARRDWLQALLDEQLNAQHEEKSPDLSHLAHQSSSNSTKPSLVAI
jgi:AcrR family transcriptional regulator